MAKAALQSGIKAGPKEASSEAEPKKAGKAGMLVTYLMATVLAAAAGAGAGFLLPSANMPQEGDTPPAKPEAKPARPVVVTPLAPILTNLAHPSDTWVRLELAVLSAEPLGEDMAESVGQDLLAFVRTARLSHMEGPSGFLTFREALDDRARSATEGKAQRVLIRTILFE